MKKLTQYKKNGYNWQLLKREGNLAIFQSGQFYEVILIQSHNGRDIAGKHCEAAEYSPSNEQWGSKGWSYSNEQDALDKFASLKGNLDKQPE